MHTLLITFLHQHEDYFDLLTELEWVVSAVLALEAIFLKKIRLFVYQCFYWLSTADVTDCQTAAPQTTMLDFAGSKLLGNTPEF